MFPSEIKKLKNEFLSKRSRGTSRYHEIVKFGKLTALVVTSLLVMTHFQVQIKNSKRKKIVGTKFRTRYPYKMGTGIHRQ